MKASLTTLALVAFAALAACGPPVPNLPPTPSPLPPRIVRYTFAIDEAIAELAATLCFEGGHPDELAPIHEDVRARLVSAEALVDGVAQPLPHDGRIDLRDVPEGACVRYRVDLAPRWRRGGGPAGTYRVGEDLVAPTGSWLLQPQPRNAETALLARFELPEGVHVSTVWPEEEDGWARLDERAFRYLAYVAFGRFEVQRIPVPGGCVEAAVLDGALSADADARERWLEVAGRTASRVLGRFPSERTSVLVVPAPFADTPVLFGVVGRGVLPTVALLVGQNALGEALVPDWTAVHEFTHLASPYVERDEAWITEGLATYYQQVLRAREGTLTPAQAWHEMVQGFARGRAEGTGRSLEDESRQMLRTQAFGRVYWAGAAIAMLADVEYRRSGEGTLDEAMIRAASRRDETVTAAELVRALDGREGGAFARTVERWIHGSEFPDVDAQLAWMGVRRGAGALPELAAADGAEVRDAIMNGDGPLASTAPGCD